VAKFDGFFSLITHHFPRFELFYLFESKRVEDMCSIFLWPYHNTEKRNPHKFFMRRTLLRKYIDERRMVRA
jgi:hypothetical protein